MSPRPSDSCGPQGADRRARHGRSSDAGSVGRTHEAGRWDRGLADTCHAGDVMNVMARTHVGDSVSPVLSLRYTPGLSARRVNLNVTNPDPANGITLKGPTGDVTLPVSLMARWKRGHLGRQASLRSARSTAPAT